MYKITHILLPQFFMNWFAISCNKNNYNTGNAAQCYVILHKPNSRAHSIRILGVKQWNTLSSNIKYSLWQILKGNVEKC